ncbi:hypothetical protein EC988_000590 [Linderina pennispora]|nr:hypothetical protein EC988_000590 [Linderina pennispora]
MWSSNYDFLVAEGMLHLVTEFRVVMNNNCPKDLHLIRAMRHYRLHKTTLPTVESVTFLGDGLFAAGKAQATLQAAHEAKYTADDIIALCPNITSMYFYTSGGWGSSARLRLMPAAVGTMTCMHLFRQAICNMATSHALTPPPESPGLRFSDDLTSLTINTSLLSPSQMLPPTVAESLRRLKITHVCRAVDWSRLSGASNSLVLPQLERLEIEFVDPGTGWLVVPVRYNTSVEFPRLQSLEVAGAKHADRNIYTCFTKYTIPLLILSADPRDFKDIDLRLLQCANGLQVKYCDSREHTDTIYSVKDMEVLYRFRTGLRMASLSGIDYPLPEVLLWDNLCWLYLTASIADVESITRLLVQLKGLETLAIRCLSMYPNDLLSDSSAAHFADQVGRFESLFKAAEPYLDAPIHSMLQRLDIYVRQKFDLIGVACLLHRLPALKYLGVNPEVATSVAQFLVPQTATSSVLVGEFSTSELPEYTGTLQASPSL